MRALVVLAMLRVGASVGHESGDHPGELYGESRSYGRTSTALDLTLIGLPATSRFGTPFGGELWHRFGLRGREPGFVDRSQPATLVWQTEGAFDVAPVHWNSGRIIAGVGAGADADLGRWFPAWGRLYPLMLARVQLFPGRLGVHLGWTWIPTTSNASRTYEHRGELALSWDRIHVGARLSRRWVRDDDGRYTIDETSAFAGWAF